MTKPREYKYADSEGYTIDFTSTGKFSTFVRTTEQGCSIDTEDIPEVIYNILKVAGFTGSEMHDVIHTLLDRIEVDLNEALGTD